MKAVIIKFLIFPQTPVLFLTKSFGNSIGILGFQNRKYRGRVKMSSIIKEKILNIFREQIQVFGIKSITLDMIARKCGISKKTLYKYFDGKDEIVSVIVDEILEKLNVRFIEADRSRAEAMDKLHYIFDAMFELLGSISVPLLRDIQTDYPEINRKIDRFRDEHRELVRRTIEAGIASGSMNSSINSSIAVDMIMGAAQAVIYPGYIIKNNLTLQSVMESFKELILNGLADVRGHKDGKVSE
jgi:AcrR family transcriptional regulator